MEFKGLAFFAKHFFRKVRSLISPFLPAEKQGTDCKIRSADEKKTKRKDPLHFVRLRFIKESLQPAKKTLTGFYGQVFHFSSFKNRFRIFVKQQIRGFFADLSADLLISF